MFPIHVLMNESRFSKSNHGVSLIIVNYGTPELLSNFLASIDRNIIKKGNLEAIVVDNDYPRKGDSRQTVEALNLSFKIHLTHNHKNSYASAINRGAQFANNDILIIANSDIEIPQNFSFEPIISAVDQNSKIGVIGPQLIYPNGRWQRSYGLVPSLKELLLSIALLDAFIHALYRYVMTWRLFPRKIRSVEYADGAFLIIRRACFAEMEGFNENYLFYGEDADFCWRAQRTGWIVTFLPTVCVIHLRGASSTQKAYVTYTTRQLRAKLQFVKENFGSRHAYYYRKLTKVVLMQRFLLYSFAASIIPLSEFALRKLHSKLSYIAAMYLTKSR